MRLLRNPILLPTTETATGTYKNDPNLIPIHFDTRQLQETFQQQKQQHQPFVFPDYTNQPQQHVQTFQKYQPIVKNYQNFEDSNHQRAYNGKLQSSLEKRGGLKKELGPIRQPRYTPKVQVQTHFRPPSPHQIYQRKVLVAKLV